VAQDYIHLFRDEPAWQQRSRNLAAKVLDFTSFLDRIAKLPSGSLDSGQPRTIVYHDSCQGLNALGLREAPRRILADVLGHDVRDLAESRVCCGFGGTFSFDYPEISDRLMTRKLDDAESSGAPLIVTDNQGCILQLRGGADAQGRALEVRHISEMVADGVLAAADRAQARGNEESEGSRTSGGRAPVT
jgi:L-lactate dehydrogenase complex protein LldF